MSILITSLKLTGALIAALASSGATYQYIATKLDEQKYPPIGKMVDVGGYKLHMIDQGTGGPTVVMDTGLAGYCLDWSFVQPEIAKFTRAITYDRAGYAWSDESPLERTSENVVKELHAMLHNTGVPAPYVLVGQSIGGLNMQLFASMYPNEVAGIVLVESSHQDQMEKLPRVDYPVYFKPAIAVILAKLGIARRFNGYFNTDTFEKYSSIQDWNALLYNSQKLTTKYVRAVMYELSNLEQSLNQLKDTGSYLGDKPLIVLTAGKQPTYEESEGWMTQKQVDQRNKAWPALQADLVTKSSRGKQIIAQNSGHTIQYDQPEIVIEAIREMVDKLRNKFGSYEITWK